MAKLKVPCDAGEDGGEAEADGQGQGDDEGAGEQPARHVLEHQRHGEEEHRPHQQVGEEDLHLQRDGEAAGGRDDPLHALGGAAAQGHQVRGGVGPARRGARRGRPFFA